MKQCHPGRGFVFGVVLWLAAASVFADAATEANIARVTANLLARSHFAAHQHGQDVSTQFLDRYLDALDGARLHFFESDLTEFAHYRRLLQDLTLIAGDTGPAQKIFARFLERLEMRVAFAKEELTGEPFDFTGKDTLATDRDRAPRPADLAAARVLWRQQLRYEYLQEKLAKKSPAEIVQTLTKRYDRTLRTMKQFSSDQVFEIYLTSLAHVYDPHSDYLGRRQLEDFSIAMSLSLYGIGAVLQAEDGYCKINELLPGGPAAASKRLKPGDRIVAVAQAGKEPVDIIEMPLSEAVRLIRGPKGTEVSLTVIPAAVGSVERETITLIRDEIKLENQEAKARLVEWPVNNRPPVRLGIIELPSFYAGGDGRDGGGHPGATADVQALIEKLQAEKIDALILDLRRNGGGSLEESIRLSGLFIETGPIVQTKDADGQVNVSRDPDPAVVYDGPLVVLTSRFSASASEILAGAVQDYGRALIVGDTSTFGKGTVQSLIQLTPMMQGMGLDGGENPGALKLTIRKFYRPSGSSTQLKGVVPDLVLPSALAVLKVGEGQMANPLPWDEIPPAKYTNLNRVAPYLPSLQRRSAKRVASDQEFIWLREDITRLRQQVDRAVVSLNEQQRLKENAEQEAREPARNKVRAERAPIIQTQYEFTLKQARLPGLPPPLILAGTNAVAAASVPGADDSADKEKNPGLDVTLEETKRICADYIELLTARAR